MDVQYETRYHQLEEQHWWFRSRRDIIFKLVQKLGIKRTSDILEIGCSSGILMEKLRDTGFTNLTGIDISDAGIRQAQQRGLTNTFVMDGAKLDFADESFDLVLASDVLEHIEDENAALREWTRLLRPGGQLIVFVPAFQFLWSQHDVVNHHFRRYSGAHLSDRVANAGLKIQRLSYWNCGLFFPAAAARLAQRFVRPANGGSDDLKPMPSWINNFLTQWVKMENSVLTNTSMPLGVSVFVIAQKPL
jgi:SAM-dependent methyltransferase